MSSYIKDSQVLALMGMGREALLKELQQKKRAEHDQLKKACLEELQHDVSEVLLRLTLLGRLETSEMLNNLKNRDEESYQSIRSFVEAADVGKDQKLNLAGILQGFRKAEQSDS
ncbi:hypothetical protein IFM46972_09371 [Aspergillus udagawae]|uniref:Uncharacterized protein n=1 Tax=Aspergillus udagawae TaxID=91492 RepID=A0A8H3S687_9EURO|nr:hypothetical protein IFM46972_09371 [Aspergillus udagawae]